jgi:hypothetical protein
MKLFSRFFRKQPPPLPTLKERIAVINAGSDDVIIATAFGADEEALRVAAICKLPDGDALRKLAGFSTAADSASFAFPTAVERAAQSRVAQLIDEGAIDFVGFCGGVKNPSVMFSVAALCKDTHRLPQALASIGDPAKIARLVVEGPSSRLRQLAAETVEDPAQLRQLLKQVRSKDKSVYKILKQKCDVLNAESRKASEIASEVSALCASLERHGHRTYDSLYTSTFEHLNSQWSALTTQSPDDMAQRASQAIDRCRDVIAAHLQQVAQQADQDAAQQAAQQMARDTRERAQQAAQDAASAQADAEAHARKEAAAIREAEARMRAEKRAEEEQLLRLIGALIGRANGALSDGNTQRAAGMRRAIEEKLSAAPVLPPYLSRHLQQLDDKLSELKQWKDYAVAPKRIELIDEMETLIGSTEEPRALAGRIKSLQQEWRTISKGIVSDAPAEWERFHRASEAAYQPCREYFQAQAKLRQNNFENRKAVLERLTTFEATQNGEYPDWRLLASVLREAPQEWRRYFPVDREAGRAIQEEFDASIGRLHAKLNGWYEHNAADKQSLIKSARRLLAQEDSREAIEAVKRLQIQWKETGMTPRDQEQSLWSEFRELCDAVYQKRQQAFADYSAGLEANKISAVTLCEEAERVAALSGKALLEEGAKIAEWRTLFGALGEMPRADARALQDRFERALDRCTAQIAQQHVRDAEQSFTNLFEAGRFVQAYEWAVARKAEASETETLKQAAETFIASVQHWPKGGLQAIKETLTKASSASETGIEAREKALRTLCIRCEIQSDTPTPPEDETLRREYQVQRLMQGMGQGSHAVDGDWDAMMLEWIRIGAVSPAVHQSLQARFVRCRANRPIRSPQRSTFQPEDSGDDGKGNGNRAGQMRRHGRDGPKSAAAR